MADTPAKPNRPASGRGSDAAAKKSGASAAGAGRSGARAAGAGKATSSGASPAGGKGGAKGGLLRRIGAVAGIGALVLALVAVLGTVAFYNATKLPDPNKDFTTNTTFVTFNDGKTKLGSFAVQNRQSIPYSQMPQSMKDAAVAAENRTFWTDRGISPSGIVRSVWTIARGGEVQGGSTITQQYIKILYLTSDRSMTRKLRELALAVKMGKKMPKEQILEGYLNTIYFGRGAYGIQAASKSYFNTDAKNLTVPQAAVLASVLNNPSIYDPSISSANKDRLLQRYRYVLDGMRQAGKITQAQQDSFSKALPKFPEIPLNQRWGGTNGYLLRMVEDELTAKGMSQSQIEGGGLQITTTFDKTLEDRAIKVGQYYKGIVGDNSSKGAANLHPAIASVEVGTGAVLAVYGGDDYLKSPRNWATTDRPAASTFKAWATVAGLRHGFSLYSRLDGNSFTPMGDSVSIRNEMNMQYGPVTLKKALTDSINTAFVDLTDRIKNGPAQIVKAANDAGVPKGAGWTEGNRMALGIAEVSPLDNATGYATLANEGKYVPSHVVKEVKDANGKVIYTGPTTGKQTIENDVARDVTYALQSVVQEGTGTRVQSLGYPVAGKTGTNGVDRNGQNVITSAWFVGATPQVSTAVMFVAGNDGNGSLDAYKRYSDTAFFGGTYPAMVWTKFMQTAMEGKEYKSFASPANVQGQYQQQPQSQSTYQQTQQQQQPMPVQTSRQQSQPTSSATSSAAPSASATSKAATTAPATAKATATQQATQQQTHQATQAPATQQATTRHTAVTQPTKAATSQRTTTKSGSSSGNSGNGAGGTTSSGNNAQPTAKASG